MSSEDRSLVRNRRRRHWLRNIPFFTSIESEPEEFSTIDWGRDEVLERNRRKEIYGERGISATLKRAFYGSQGWQATLFIGIAAGAFAGVIDIGAEWMIDLKLGVCPRYFWVPRTICCRDYEDLEACPHWKTWAEIFGVAEESSAQLYIVNYIMFCIAAMLLGGFSAFLVRAYAPYAAGSGIPEVKTILGGFVIKSFLSLWSLIIKAFGLILSVGSGLSLGKEGPLVHVACCCGSIVSSFYRKYSTNEAKKREILSAACAAGVSVAFGAPVGGILFSLEEASSYFPPKTLWRSFFSAVVAALVLQLINPNGTGQLTMFKVQYHQPWHWFELPVFAFLGVFGGVAGALYNALNIRMARLRKNTFISNWPVGEVVAVSAFTALVSYWNPFLRISSSELLDNLFTKCSEDTISLEDDLCKFTWSSLLMIAAAGIIKFILTVFTFGLRVPAGLFIPSLGFGAVMGHICGILMFAWHKNHPASFVFSECTESEGCVIPGMYALVGASAALGGVTRVTVSLVVIMFELTGGLEYIVPIMLAVVISKWVGDAFNRESVYEMYIHLNGYPFLDNKVDVDVPGSAKDMMVSRKLMVIPSKSASIRFLENLLKEHKYQGFPVIHDDQGMLIAGYITRQELQNAIDQTRADPRVTPDTIALFSPSNEPHEHSVDEDYLTTVDFSHWLDETPIQVVETTPIDRIYDLFRALGLRYVLVSRSSNLVGIITKKDCLEFVKKHEHSKSKNEREPPKATQPRARLIRR
eukprot:gb/GECH01003107.1/.p1 GENE.gb/GECH01003107.1/~~gb/GECH01003107.1/.p1  ORF type:complete len:752 (+),score=138.65 gb/GECH01003107.1/:1-2256(+)